MNKKITLEMLRDDVADYRSFVEQKDYSSAMLCFERIGPVVRKLYQNGVPVRVISRVTDLHEIAVRDHIASVTL